MIHKPMKHVAVVAGLSLGLALGGGVYALSATQPVYAAVITQQQAEINVPNATMTDPSQESGQAIVNNIYNKEFYTINADGAPIWQTNDAGTGEFTFYFSAKGKNGQTYYSWPATKQGLGLRTIFD